MLTPTLRSAARSLRREAVRHLRTCRSQVALMHPSTHHAGWCEPCTLRAWKHFVHAARLWEEATAVLDARRHDERWRLQRDAALDRERGLREALQKIGALVDVWCDQPSIEANEEMCAIAEIAEKALEAKP